MTEGTQRRLTTIVAADIAGFSRLVGNDEEGTLAAQRNLRTELIEPLLAEFDGQIANTAGDSFLFEFPSAVQAVRCSIAVQDSVAERNHDVPSENRIEYRIGINVGDVVADGDDLLGDGVNVAARLEELAEPGRIYISRSVRDQVRDRMDISLEDLGEVEVKNIARPVRVFKVMNENEAAAPYGKPTISTKPKWFVPAITALVLIAVIAGAGTWWWTQQPDFEPADSTKFAYKLPDKPSIAVLPFEYLGAQQEEFGYLAAGVSQSVIGTLGFLSGILVIDWQAAQSLKVEKDRIQGAAEKFGVRFILTGTVQKSENQLRVTASLADALNGRLAWSKSFDRDLSRWFEIQDEISKEIAVSMLVKFQAGGQDSVRVANTTRNLTAFKLFLRGNDELRKYTSQSTTRALNLFLQAEQEDPKFVASMVLRSVLKLVSARFGYVQDRKRALAEALAISSQARKALPDAAIGLGYDGFLDLWRGNKQDSIAKVEQAVQMLPNSSFLQQALGNVYLYTGRPKDALAPLILSGRIFINFEPGQSFHLITALVDAGEYSRALTEIDRKTRMMGRTDVSDLTYRALALAGSGRISEARRDIQDLLKQSPKATVRRLFNPIYHPYSDDQGFKKHAQVLADLGLPLDAEPMSPTKPAIAVLPFANLSDDKEQEYFADGMTDDLITDLSRVSGLNVIARNSVFTYKGKNVKVQEVAKDLNVTHILEGSVRRAGNQVRINAQLINAKTGEHLWAETFDREFADIFALQDKVTGDIVAALKVKLTPGEQNKLSGKPTDNLDAYDAFLNGWSYFLRRTPKDYAQALTWLEKAVALDPAFGRAWAALAALYHEAIQRNWDIELAIDPKKLKFLLDKALAHPTPLALQVAAESAGQDTNRIFAYLDQASALDPNNADTYMIRALMTDWSGNAEEAIRLAEKSVQLDPHHTAHNLYVLGRAQYSAGKSGQAIRTLRRAMARNESDYFPLIFLTAAYAAAGRLEEAKASAENLIKRRHELGLENTWIGDFSASYKDQNMNLAADLIAAGISETLSLGQLNLTTKDRITGSALTKHIFGMKAEGRANGGIWTHLRDHQGRTKHLWNGQHIADSVDRIENDKLIMEGSNLNPQRLECAQYRNSKGSKAAFDEYVGVCLSGVYPYAAFPLPK
jgi:TolB-like protein/class 3 adenylate cyclase